MLLQLLQEVLMPFWEVPSLAKKKKMIGRDVGTDLPNWDEPHVADLGEKNVKKISATRGKSPREIVNINGHNP